MKNILTPTERQRIKSKTRVRYGCQKVSSKHIFIFINSPNTSWSIIVNGCSSNLTTAAPSWLKCTFIPPSLLWDIRDTRSVKTINGVYLKKNLPRQPPESTSCPFLFIHDPDWQAQPGCLCQDNIDSFNQQTDHHSAPHIHHALQFSEGGFNCLTGPLG